VNFRRPIALALLLTSLLLAVPTARADISGNRSAICGGVMRTMDEVEQSIAAGLEPTGFAPFTYAEPSLAAFGKLLDAYDAKAAKEAREKIAAFIARQNTPGMRTNAMLFSGAGAVEFLKSSVGEAKEIGAQAKKNWVMKKWMVATFGVLAMNSLAGIPNLLEMDSDKWWYVVPAAVFATAFGKPVVQALLRMKKSPLEKFMVEEFAKIGASSTDGALHVFSMTAKSTSDVKTLVTIEENARAPWAQQIVIDNQALLQPRVSRIARGKNPLKLGSKKAQIDLIALPYGPDRQRQILVLTAEGI
jgi:hypothetical protein